MIVSSPGKLMFAGEWAVLESGVPCIAMAVDKRIFVEIKEAEKISVKAKDIELGKKEGVFEENKMKWENLKENDDKRILFAGKAIEVTLNYLKEKKVSLKTFSIDIKSDVSKITFKGITQKIGFGSSAAVTVAVAGAVLLFHGFDLNEEKTKKLLFKLSVISHYLAQGKLGSGFDVASSVYGGMLVYKKFDSQWVEKELENGLAKIVDKKWETLELTPLEIPKSFCLSVGFSGNSASTKELVLKIREFKKENPEEYGKIITSIREIVEKMIKAIKENDKEKILRLINENRMVLKELSDESKAGLETKELTRLIEEANKFKAAAKFSGAGGGDNGIAISFDLKTKRAVEEAWIKAGILPLAVQIAKNGCERE